MKLRQILSLVTANIPMPLSISRAQYADPRTGSTEPAIRQSLDVYVFGHHLAGVHTQDGANLIRFYVGGAERHVTIENREHSITIRHLGAADDYYENRVVLSGNYYECGEGSYFFAPEVAWYRQIGALHIHAWSAVGMRQHMTEWAASRDRERAAASAVAPS